tara:strand:- start:159 stop:791 length:633 start_codon:yes stop_codon:yes gene_type:complete
LLTIKELIGKPDSLDSYSAIKNEKGEIHFINKYRTFMGWGVVGPKMKNDPYNSKLRTKCILLEDCDCHFGLLLVENADRLISLCQKHSEYYDVWGPYYQGFRFDYSKMGTKKFILHWSEQPNKEIGRDIVMGYLDIKEDISLIEAHEKELLKERCKRLIDGYWESNKFIERKDYVHKNSLIPEKVIDRMNEKIFVIFKKYHKKQKGELNE